MADADPAPITARVLAAASDVPAAAWDACAGTANPFTRHAFLSALEDSGSASPRAGWQPAHLAIGPAAAPAALMPAYLKSHSQGEYVFDHGWADAFARAGGRYYPKLQASVPFTPATGPRLLGDPAFHPALLAAAETVVDQNGLSSAHATFIVPAQLGAFEQAGWLIRTDQQFHWENAGYATFDDFLGALASAKRKTVRRERRDALADGITVRHLSGADLREEHWDAFWRFYQDTGSRKWGRPYLTRRFFSLVTERMADAVLLMLAYRGAKPIAGALNFIGADALYGRNWGCVEDVPFLHFELCYYQAIEWAIAHRLARVEAGAQGEHKLARGYLPTTTYSAHHLAHPGLRDAVAAYLAVEREAVAAQGEELAGYAPYRKAD